MNWKVIFTYGFALLISGAIIGFFESEFEPAVSLFALLIAQFLILSTLAYRQAQRAFLHAVFAIAIETALATAIVGAIKYFLHLPSYGSDVSMLIQWVIVLLALFAGVPAGSALRKHVASRRSLGGA